MTTSTERLRHAVYSLWRKQVANALRDAVWGDRKFCPYRAA